MSKVNYRKCDICDKILNTDKWVPSGFSNGYRIWNRLFNRLDICNDCLTKIKQLLIDIKEEEKCVQEIFDRHEQYEDIACESAYLQGVEDVLGVLSHNRLRNIKIKK